MAWFKRKKEQRSLENPQVPISSSNIVAFLGMESVPISGEIVSPRTALKVPAIWGAVNFLSSTIASLPLKVYQKSGDGREEMKSKLSSLLHDAPNQQWTSYRWRKYSMTNVLLRGRSLTFVERNKGGQIIALWPLEPSKVTVKRYRGEIVYEYTGPPKAIYSADEIIDIPFLLDEDQDSTVSPVERLADAIGLSLALQRYASMWFSQGGVPPLVLQGPQMSPAAAKRASDDIKAAIRKAAKAGEKAFAIPEGYELKPIGGNPEDSQLEASRRFQLEEVARVYGLPPVFLQDLTRATFSNAEQQDLHLVKHTLTGWLNAWEQELNLKLFPQSNRTKYVEFNLDGLLRGDFKTRMDGYAQGIQNSILMPNEVRAMENRAPADGGDKLFIQQNMSAMKDLPAPADGEDSPVDPDQDPGTRERRY